MCSYNSYNKYMTLNFTETGNPKQGGAVQHEDQF